MQQLLQITTVPAQIEFKVNNARLETVQAPAELQVSRQKGGLTIRTKPIKISIDTSRAQYSAGIKTPFQSVADNASYGKKVAYEATAAYAEQGNMLLNIHLNSNPFAEIAMLKLEKNTESMLTFIPSVGPDISWSDPEINIEFQMDRLNFDWKINRPEVKFIPGNIEFNIKEYAKITFEYVGEPIYVPASANPNYKATLDQTI